MKPHLSSISFTYTILFNNSFAANTPVFTISLVVVCYCFKDSHSGGFRITTLLRNLFPTSLASAEPVASEAFFLFCGLQELERAMAIRQEWREFKINATSISLMSEMFVCVLTADCCKACEIHSQRSGLIMTWTRP